MCMISHDARTHNRWMYGWSVHFFYPYLPLHYIVTYTFRRHLSPFFIYSFFARFPYHNYLFLFLLFVFFIDNLVTFFFVLIPSSPLTTSTSTCSILAILSFHNVFAHLLPLIILIPSELQQMRDVRSRDRTPSFYTSRSILHLSGLSVADPVTPGCHRISPKSRSPSKSENDENFVSDCREGQEQSDSSTDSDDDNRDSGLPLGIQKTTSMSNFYYKRGGSSDEFPRAVERTTSA